MIVLPCLSDANQGELLSILMFGYGLDIMGDDSAQDVIKSIRCKERRCGLMRVIVLGHR